MKIEKPADNATQVAEHHAANRIAWNEAAVKYTEDIDKSAGFINEGKSSLHPVEKKNLGNLKEWCTTAVHLQCASGLDTLSLLNEGAERVIGVDISDVHIENAEKLTALTDSNAEWYRCDVLDIPSELDGTADLVYTGRGALCWIHDIQSWAAVCSRLLKPGGVFHILDGHPLTWLIDENSEDLTFNELDYFQCAMSVKGWSTEYIGELDKPAEKLAVKHERLWPLSSTVNALISSGLTIEYLGEHTEEYWNALPNLNQKQKSRIPMTYSIKARKQLNG